MLMNIEGKHDYEIDFVTRSLFVDGEFKQILNIDETMMLSTALGLLKREGSTVTISRQIPTDEPKFGWKILLDPKETPKSLWRKFSTAQRELYNNKDFAYYRAEQIEKLSRNTF